MVVLTVMPKGLTKDLISFLIGEYLVSLCRLLTKEEYDLLKEVLS